MSRNRVLTAVLGVAVAFYGCGGTNNDQGVTFNHLGYFSTFEGAASCDSLPAGLLQISVPLGLVNRGDPFENPDFSQIPSDTLDGSVRAVVGFQNHLSGQGMSVRRALLSYFIPGATEQPPTTTVALNGTLGPADELGTGGTFDSTLPPSFAGREQCGLSTIAIVPPAVFRWILFNQDKLPETPFLMEVTSTIIASSTSGNEYESNPQTLSVVFTPETSIPATDTAGDTGASTTEGVSSEAAGDTSENTVGDTTDDTLDDTENTDDTSSGDGSDL